MNWTRFVVAIGVAGLYSASLIADECIGPQNARLFASELGTHIFKVAQKKSERPEGTLISIADNFRERRLWRARLVNIPLRVVVPDDGRTVVTVENAGCGFGSAHSIVVYGAAGRVIADYGLEDILSAPEISQHTKRTMAGRHWIDKVHFSFESGLQGNGALVVTFHWGRQVKIDLLTGAINSSGAAGG
jgi:hypothetical protein